MVDLMAASVGRRAGDGGNSGCGLFPAQPEGGGTRGAHRFRAQRRRPFTSGPVRPAHYAGGDEIANPADAGATFSATSACSEMRAKPASPGTGRRGGHSHARRRYWYPDVRPVRIPSTSGANHTPAPPRAPRNRIHCQSRCPPLWARRILLGRNFDSTGNNILCEKNFNGKIGGFSGLFAPGPAMATSTGRGRPPTTCHAPAEPVATDSFAMAAVSRARRPRLWQPPAVRVPLPRRGF